VTDLLGSEVVVHEVEVPDQGPVVQRGAIRSRPAPADQRADPAPPEVVDLVANGPDRRTVERADGAAEAIEYVPLQEPKRLRGKVGVGHACRERGDLFNCIHVMLLDRNPLSAGPARR
jgi:hypothetical protein